MSITRDEATDLVCDRAVVRVYDAQRHGVFAEGEVVAYSVTPQICVRDADGRQTWWPISLPIEVLP